MGPLRDISMGTFCDQPRNANELANELSVLQSYLSQKELEQYFIHENEGFFAWYDKTRQEIMIQPVKDAENTLSEKNKLKIRLSEEGKVLSAVLNNFPSAGLHAAQIQWILAAYREVLNEISNDSEPGEKQIEKEAFEPRNPRFISQKDLLNLQKVLSKLTAVEGKTSHVVKVEVDKEFYNLWFDKVTQRMCLQSRRDYFLKKSLIYSIKLNNAGQITQFLINHQSKPGQLPEKMNAQLHWVEYCLQEASFKAIHLNETLDNVQHFQPDYLVTLKHFLTNRAKGVNDKLRLTVEEKIHYIWFDQKENALNIQEQAQYKQKNQQKKVSIFLDKSDKQALLIFEGNPVTHQSVWAHFSFLNRARKCVRKACKALNKTANPEQTTAYPHPANLQVLRAYMQLFCDKAQVQIANFQCFYNKNTDTISLEDRSSKKELKLIINETGKITSFCIGGKYLSPDAISKKHLQMINSLAKETRKCCSHYIADEKINIFTLLRTISEMPEFHLTSLVNTFKQFAKAPHLRVKFFEDDLTEEVGVDIEGLGREFMSELGKAILHSKKLSFATLKPSNLCMPQTKKPYQIGEELPSLTGEEKQLFENLGKLLIFCYATSGLYTIGQQFDPTLFHALLCFSEREVNLEFEKLGFNTQLKVAKALLTSRADINDKSYLERINLLIDYDKLDDEGLKKAAMHICYTNGLFKSDEDHQKWFTKGDTAKLRFIKANRQQFKQLLKDAVFSPQNAFGQLGRQIAAIHRIAKGMNCHFTNWQELIQNHFLDLNRSIQGSLDRKEIVENIYYDGSSSEIKKKVGWLKKWIKEEASDKELRAFLRYTTGSSSLPRNKKIAVRAQDENSCSPLPKSRTCFCQLTVAPVVCKFGELRDDTETHFIQCLKVAIKQSGYQFS